MLNECVYLLNEVGVWCLAKSLLPFICQIDKLAAYIEAEDDEVDDDDDGVGDLASPFDDDEGDVDESKYGRLQAYLMYWMRSRLRLCASF